YDAVIGFPDGGDVVSYLPMAHIAERNCSHYFPMGFGFRVTCCPDAREVITYLPEVRPAWFFAVPRIWEKLKAGLEASGSRGSGIGSWPAASPRGSGRRSTPATRPRWPACERRSGSTA